MAVFSLINCSFECRIAAFSIFFMYKMAMNFTDKSSPSRLSSFCVQIIRSDCLRTYVVNCFQNNECFGSMLTTFKTSEQKPLLLGWLKISLSHRSSLLLRILIRFSNSTQGKFKNLRFGIFSIGSAGDGYFTRKYFLTWIIP